MKPQSPITVIRINAEDYVSTESRSGLVWAWVIGLAIAALIEIAFRVGAV